MNWKGLRFSVFVFVSLVAGMMATPVHAQGPGCGNEIDFMVNCQTMGCTATINSPGMGDDDCWQVQFQHLCSGMPFTCGTDTVPNWIWIGTCNNGKCDEEARLLPIVKEFLATAIYAVGCDGNLHLYLPDPKIFESQSPQLSTDRAVKQSGG